MMPYLFVYYHLLIFILLILMMVAQTKTTNIQQSKFFTFQDDIYFFSFSRLLAVLSCLLFSFFCFLNIDSRKFYFQLNENKQEDQEVFILSTNVEGVRFSIRSITGQSLEKNSLHSRENEENIFFQRLTSH